MITLFCRHRRGEYILVCPTDKDGKVLDRANTPDEVLIFDGHRGFIDETTDAGKKKLELIKNHPKFGPEFWITKAPVAKLPDDTQYEAGPTTTAHRPVATKGTPPEVPMPPEPEKAPLNVPAPTNPTLTMLENPDQWNHKELVTHITPIVEINYPNPDDPLNQAFKEFVVGLEIDLKTSISDYSNEELVKMHNAIIEGMG